MGRLHRLRRSETGAETVEFALVAPLVLFLIFGLIYGFLGMAAQLSLTHAASVGVRFATMPTDAPTNTYPSVEAVKNKVLASTPFFKAEDCAAPTVNDESGTPTPNREVTLTISCDFPNPAGAALGGISGLFGGEGASYDGELTLTASVTGRRE